MKIRLSYLGNPLHMSFARASLIFTNWLNNLSPELEVHRVVLTHVDFRGEPSAKTVLFIRLQVFSPQFPHGQVAELRGNTVAMLVLLNCEGETYTVLTKQKRIPVGTAQFVEVPAGMIDDNTFAGAAACEIEEELGLKFAENELKNLTPSALYLSPGLLDEACTIYYAERDVSRKELKLLEGKVTGLEEEHEHITLMIVPFDLMLKYTCDAKSVLAHLLYTDKR